MSRQVSSYFLSPEFLVFFCLRVLSEYFSFSCLLNFLIILISDRGVLGAVVYVPVDPAQVRSFLGSGIGWRLGGG